MIAEKSIAKENRAYGSQRRVDWLLVLASALLIFAGMLALYSLGVDPKKAIFLRKQIFNCAIGAVAMAVAASIDPQIWQRLWRPLYWINMGLLLLVFIVGHKAKGATRWIDLGPLQFQPSELSKIICAITLAAFFAENRDAIRDKKTFFRSMLHIAPPLALVLMQPHLGGTVSIILIWLTISVYAGVPWKFPVTTFVAVLAILVAMFFSPQLPDNMKYMKDRIVAMISGDSKSDKYQQHQAGIAIGSGGLLGKGYLKGDVKKGGFVPEQQNDFILTVVGEEGGLVGMTFLFAAYIFFFYRVWLAGFQAPSYFGKLVAGGLFAVLSFHTVVNIGMNIGLTPVVGLWLPFMSSGGTALIMCMMTTGLILAVRRFE